MKTGVLLIGAGGHAKVCIELLREMGEDVAYCIGGADSPEKCLNVPVLKGDEHLSRLRSDGYSKLFVAIGSNDLRLQLGALALELGFNLVNAISQKSIISSSVELGVGVAVMAGAVINAEVLVGDFSIINTGACVDHDCQIGKAVHIAPQCALAGNVVIGDNSFIGIGSKIIPNVIIGENALIGAGGVVVSDVEPGTINCGVPTQPIKNR